MDDVVFTQCAKYGSIQAWSLRRRELFTVTRQVAPLNCVPGATSDIVDCLVCIVNVNSEVDLDFKSVDSDSKWMQGLGCVTALCSLMNIIMFLRNSTLTTLKGAQ